MEMKFAWGGEEWRGKIRKKRRAKSGQKTDLPWETQQAPKSTSAALAVRKGPEGGWTTPPGLSLLS